MNNKEAAEIFSEIGYLLELKGENPFKSRAYHQASRIIESLEEYVGDILDEIKAGKIKGIGKGLSEKIEELATSGGVSYLDELRAEVPAGLLEMRTIPGLGPKKIKALYETLHIDSIESLAKACEDNKIAELEGFGQRSQEKILEGIAYIHKFSGQFLYSHSIRTANEILTYLKNSREIEHISIAGSLRRKKEVVKDIDIIAGMEHPEDIMDVFVSYKDVISVTGKGETKSSVVLRQGINADLRIVTSKEYPFALHHFTGRREHNTKMRARAKRFGLKMNEYGLFREDDSIVRCGNEQEIFNALELDYIPPELREGMDEIEAAEKGEIPRLLESGDLKGILHVHSRYSDGMNTIEEMAQAVRKSGYSYLGICDHSRSASYAGGLKPDDVRRQHDEISRLNQTMKGFTIFKGIESDILADGSLDYSDEILSSFDFVVISVHSGFNMTEEKMTDRIIRAMHNPFTTILGHPTGRLLLSREAYPVNMKALIDAARDLKVAIELNANPMRLDIDWRHIRYAKESGVPISINPDAHYIDGISDVEYGIGIARKGWLTAKDVLNTRTADEMAQFFRSKGNGK